MRKYLLKLALIITMFVLLPITTVASAALCYYTLPDIYRDLCEQYPGRSNGPPLIFTFGAGFLFLLAPGVLMANLLSKIKDEIDSPFGVNLRDGEKSRVVDEKVTVYSAPRPTSKVMGELHACDEITLGKLITRKNMNWRATSLPTGGIGFVSDIIVLRMRNVVLSDSSVEVLESPAAGAKIKMTFKKGDRFRLTGLAREGRRWWIEVRIDFGDVGFISGETNFTDIPRPGGSRDNV